ncbi:hypothetical protein EV426DRAFT_622262 [Tirmania nivea]|nr:hypothetical protein EV426DRAFT_622262 [Tirmania nivea]
MSLFCYRSQSHACVLFTILLSILSLTSIVTANAASLYDLPIPLHFSSCTPAQISSLTSEINLIRQLSTFISENWQNHNYSAHIRNTYDYFYTAGDTEPLYSYESAEVRGGLRRILKRLGEIQVLGAGELRSQSPGRGERKKMGRGEGLRVICKPKREADCGNSVGEGVEAFVSNGPTVRVGSEVEVLAIKPTGNVPRRMKDQRLQDSLEGDIWQTKQRKEKHREHRHRGKWLLTNGNDVHLCSLFWKNKSLHVSNPWQALREIPVGDFVDYRLLTLMHELTHTHILTGDLFLSPSHEDRLSLGLLDHGYGLRQPRSVENPDPSRLPRTYGERVVRKYDDSGKPVGRQVKEVPYVTELSSSEAWGNADTLVYFVFVAWQGECLNGHSHEFKDRGERHGRKTRDQRLREIEATYTNRMCRQIAIQHTGRRFSGLGGLMGGCAQKCPPGKDPILEVLRGSKRGRSELKRVWCKSSPTVREKVQMVHSRPIHRNNTNQL